LKPSGRKQDHYKDSVGTDAYPRGNLIAKEKLYRPAGYIVFETKIVFPSSEKFPAPGKMSKKAPKGPQSTQF
jgi:hypothetical protein